MNHFLKTAHVSYGELRCCLVLKNFCWFLYPPGIIWVCLDPLKKRWTCFQDEQKLGQHLEQKAPESKGHSGGQLFLVRSPRVTGSLSELALISLLTSRPFVSPSLLSFLSLSPTFCFLTISAFSHLKLLPIRTSADLSLSSFQCVHRPLTVPSL